MKKKRFIKDRASTIILIAFLVILFIGINMFFEKKNTAQIDVTEEHLFSLTDTTKDLIGKIKKDVNIYAYGYNEDSTFYDFLCQYSAYNKKITVKTITETNDYASVTKYGLGATNSVVIECGEKSETFNPDYDFTTYDYSTGQSIDMTEEKITNAIIRVTSDETIKVYFASGNNVNTGSELSYLKSYLTDQVYECIDLNLMSVTEIPEDCRILAICNPQEDITESEANIIKDYINKGGNLFITALTDENGFPNFNSVLDMYNAKIKYGVIYESNTNNTLAYQNRYAMPTVLLPNLSGASKITKDLYNNGAKIIVPWAQVVSVDLTSKDGASFSLETLLTTSDKSYNITDLTRSEYDNAYLESLEKGAFIIGTKIVRETESASSELIIFANTTFYTDYFRMGDIEMNPISNESNVSLLLNSFADLAGEEDLITVRKYQNDTTFEASTKEDNNVKLIIFAVPFAIILVGIIVWTIRKRMK